ncbi:MAG: hypothetical protein JWN78_2180 [Bacteroidota bacterium]|nr:hypothetical protein [Bacteroidota bacterium]
MQTTNYLSFLFEFEIETFKDYLSDLNKFIEQKYKVAADIYGVDSDEFQSLRWEYTRLFYRSTFISIMSFVEHNLNEMCNSIKHENKYDVDIKDLRGRGILRAKLYIEKVHKIRMEPLNVELNKIMFYSEIRNKIVHADGDIEKNEFDKIKTNIINLDYNDYGLFRQIKINKEFLDCLLEDIVIFFKKLDSVLVN